MSLLFRSGLFVFLAFAVSACGGGGGGGSGDDDSSGSDGGSTTPGVGAVTPSLGAIKNATVNIYEANNETLLTSIDMGDSTSIDFDFSSTYSGPVVVEVVGDNDATYYDENGLTAYSFQGGEAIHALLPQASGNVTATMLTDIAYQIAEENNLWPVTARVANTLNATVRHALAHELDSITTAPILFDSNTTSGSLGNDNAGRYAAKLAALAQMSDESRPAIDVLEKLRDDYSDGSFGGSFTTTFFDFVLDNELRRVAEDFGTSALQNSIPDFGYVSGILNRGILDLGVDREGATVRLGGGVFPAYDVNVTGPDSQGYMTLASSSAEGSSEIRFKNEPGVYTCSNDANGTAIEMQFTNGPVFTTAGAGECELVVIQADNAVEGFASGVIVYPELPDYQFTDGYFYSVLN